MDSFVFLGFGFDAWITIITVFAMFTVLLFTKLRSDVVFLCAVGVLYVTGVLDTQEALSGLSQVSVAVVCVLFVVIAGLMHTGVLQWIVKNLLGTPKGYARAVLRLMLPVAALSSFLSNTTVVALFVNIVKMWSKKLGISPSKLLIPLSYASGMGGVCTLIGTPPNLIISGLYEERTGEAMNILATTIPGLFCLAVGVLSIIALRRLLPNRKSPEEAFEEARDYTVEMLVPSDNPHIGMTVGELNLNTVRGGSLIEIRHFDDEKILSPVPDDEPIMGGDRLIYAGQIAELLELKMSHGLVNADHPVFHYEDAPKSRHHLRTAYITFSSDLIGTTMSANGFEKEHKVTLVAVSRQGQRIEQSPREVVLRAGDTLLMESFNELKVDTQTMRRDLHFFESEEIPNIGWRTLFSSLIMIAMVTLSALGVLPLLQCAILAVFAMFIFRCCTPEQAMRSINWDILMIFACSAVLGVAIQKTGIADRMATGILDICGTNPIVVMTAICFAATFITEFISNTAAGAMFFPIMYESAIKLGYEPFPFLIALMIAVSSSFATPIGSPTHMLVYAPGGYRFNDFLKIGLLMNIIILVANILIVNLVYPLTPLP